MSRPRMTLRAEQAIERMWGLRRRGLTILRQVVAEWESDPMSVQCFDLSMVNEAKKVMAELERLEREHPRF